MLPRVSAALSTLVSPISSAKASQGGTFERTNVPKQEIFKRFSKEAPEQETPKEQAQVVPLHGDQGVAPDRALMTPAPPTQSLSVAHSLVHLIGMLKDQSGKLTQWMAVKSYRKASKGKKSQVRKGAMLDCRVD